MMEKENNDDRDDEEEEEEWRVKPEDEVGEVKRWCVRWWRRGYEGDDDEEDEIQGGRIKTQLESRRWRRRWRKEH